MLITLVKLYEQHPVLVSIAAYFAAVIVYGFTVGFLEGMRGQKSPGAFASFRAGERRCGRVELLTGGKWKTVGFWRKR